MLDCYTDKAENMISIIPIIHDQFGKWYERQTSKIKNWVNASDFKAKSASFCFIPDKEGNIGKVLLGLKSEDDFWALGALPNHLPEGNYQLDANWKSKRLENVAIAWGLGSYKFTQYKKDGISKAKLVLTDSFYTKKLETLVSTINLIRDLVNTPAEDMNPNSLAKVANSIAMQFAADMKQTIGDDLLKSGFNAIHTVGRASSIPPRLIDIRWGKSKNPKLVLVGKGVCFDSGGLDIKPSSAMKDMKSDMGGAAHALGLAKIIMTMNLPVNLRVLIPSVENSVSANSYRVGDIIKTYKGKTVEVDNTDAEGRLILADALALACEEKPDLIIDFSTLTGAAVVALGEEIPSMFTDDNLIAEAILNHSNQEMDPVWRMPIYEGYRDLLDSHIADISNNSSSRYGGAITATLFLKEFVDSEISWVHFDLEAMNSKDKSGRPKGGEVRALRALFSYLQKRYG